MLIWFITGTSSGFGSRLVAEALARGDRVIATARSLESLEGLKGPEDRLRCLQLDVTDSAKNIQATVDEAVEIWGRIDVLVNNAGYSQPGVLEEGGVDLLRQQFDTNVFGLLAVTNAVLPHMRAQKSGKVVVMGSRSGWKTDIPALGIYCSSKAAVHSIGESLAFELAQFNIEVLIVIPGSFRTEGIYRHRVYAGNLIADYDDFRHKAGERYHNMAGTEKGDPNKAMEAVADVVRGEGCAKGREWPMYLVLGEDAEEQIKVKCNRVTGAMDQWLDVTRGCNYPE